MIGSLLWLAALALEPAPVVPPAAAVATAATPAPVADGDIREYAAIVGRKAVGKPVSGPFGTADKVLIIARDDKGFPAVAASFGFSVRDSLPAPPAGTLAVVRLHQKPGVVVPGPTEDSLAIDADYVDDDNVIDAEDVDPTDHSVTDRKSKDLN